MIFGIDTSLAPMAPHLDAQPVLPAALTEIWVDISGPGHLSSTSIYPTPNVLPTLSSPGIHLATVRARTTEGYSYIDRVAFNVLDAMATENLLRQKWDAVWGMLLAGNTDGALTYFVSRSRERYRGIFTRLQSSLPQILSSIETFALFSVTNEEAQAEALRTESGTMYSYPIVFFWGEDGKWKFREF